MNKKLIIAFIIILLGGVLLYFFVFRTPASDTTSQTALGSKMDTSFDLETAEKLNDYSPHGEFPIQVTPDMVGREDPFQPRSF